jgi:hypothetical protein
MDLFQSGYTFYFLDEYEAAKQVSDPRLKTCVKVI